MARRNLVDQIFQLNQFQCEAVMAGFTRKLQQEFNITNHAIECLDFTISAGRIAEGARKGARRGVRKGAGEEHYESVDVSSMRSQTRGVISSHHLRLRSEERLGSVKLRIPSFIGKIDHDAYLEWEDEMELVFNYHHYTEEKKIKLATSGFSGHAIHWWDQIASTRRRNGEPHITSWFDLKLS